MGSRDGPLCGFASTERRSSAICGDGLGVIVPDCPHANTEEVFACTLTRSSYWRVQCRDCGEVLNEHNSLNEGANQ